MSRLLTLHLVLGGLWLGCVLTEALFERALLNRGDSERRVLASLHWRVDMLIELPVLSAMVVTGGLLIQAATPDVLLTAKIACALIAIAANLWCVRLVRRRLQHAMLGDWDGFWAVDVAQHRWGAVVLAGIVGAIGIGAWRVGL